VDSATLRPYRVALAEAIGVTVSDADELQPAGRHDGWPESIAAVKRAAELGDVSLLTNKDHYREHLAQIVARSPPFATTCAPRATRRGQPNKVGSSGCSTSMTPTGRRVLH